MIRLYLKISKELMCVIFQDRFWVVHKLFVRMVKLQFLAQFQVDNLAYPVVPSIIHFLCCYYYHYHYLTVCEFFTTALAGGLSLESVRQHVSRTFLSMLADL